MIGEHSIVMADPPWKSTADDRSARSAAAHYGGGTMSVEDLCRMGPAVMKQTTPRSRLFMWATGYAMPEALEVMSSWGYRFSTVAFVWVKLNQNPIDDFNLATAFQKVLRATEDERPIITHGGKCYRSAFGMGHTTRAGAEYCLLGKRGRVERDDGGVEQLIFSPVREHSRKPDEAYLRIERLFRGEKKLELFARERRPGWSGHGDELGKFSTTET